MLHVLLFYGISVSCGNDFPLFREQEMNKGKCPNLIGITPAPSQSAKDYLKTSLLSFQSAFNLKR